MYGHEPYNHDLLQVYQQLIEGKIDIRINQRELLCARQWNQITKDFGYSKVIPKQTIASIAAKTLEAICKGGNI